MTDKVCVGLDIGYSNVKLSYIIGDQEPVSVALPSGAAPLGALPRGVMGSSKLDDMLMVNLGEKTWGACIRHDLVEDLARVTDKEYAFTDTYMALYLASLSKVGQKTVDTLVTGLPVNQAQDEAFCAKLKQRLQGTHKINENLTVFVKEVSIVAQPAGAYFNYLLRDEVEQDFVESVNVLIVDPGYFSFDWFVMKEGSVRNRASGTSTQASSKIIEHVAASIRSEHGGVALGKIEDIIRKGMTEVSVAGAHVNIESYLKRAKEEIAKNAVQEMTNSLRSEESEPDIIIMAGGGASFFVDEVKARFKTNNFYYDTEQSVLMNSKGFLNFAESTEAEKAAV